MKKPTEDWATEKAREWLDFAFGSPAAPRTRDPMTVMALAALLREVREEAMRDAAPENYPDSPNFKPKSLEEFEVRGFKRVNR